MVNDLLAIAIETRNRQELIFQRTGLIIQKEVAMAGELDALQAQVSRNGEVDQSAVTLLQGLHQKLQDAINAGDPAKLQALADSLKASTDSLADAVVANTPAETPTPTP